MAATFALALAAVPEQTLETICTAKPIHRAPVDAALAAAFGGLDPDWERRLAWRLARRAGCRLDDAEEAIGHELVLLIESRKEVFLLEDDRWLGLLFVRSRFRLFKNHSAPPLFSTNAIEAALGEGTLGDAQPCVPETPQAEQDAIGVRLPGPGEKWTRQQVRSALQRFYRYHGRAPRTCECRAADRLPSATTIRRLFGTYEKALIAAGIPVAEPGRRRRRVPSVEAARACRSFYRRHNYWPDASDRARDPDLPSRGAWIRCFGSTHGGEVRDVAEAILATAEHR